MSIYITYLYITYYIDIDKDVDIYLERERDG